MSQYNIYAKCLISSIIWVMGSFNLLHLLMETEHSEEEAAEEVSGLCGR